MHQFVILGAKSEKNIKYTFVAIFETQYVVHYKNILTKLLVKLLAITLKSDI